LFKGIILNLASALIYKILDTKDYDTWVNVRKHYLTPEYHTLFDVINKHTDNYHKLPSIAELELEIRDGSTLEKLLVLEENETEAEPYILLEYLKSEYAQKEALNMMEHWVDVSIAFETAEEVVRHIQQIGAELETKVELIPSEETMQRINLFDSEEELDARIKLGFNTEFDNRFNFRTTDYIMVGGIRGAGKSITGSNIARNVITQQKKKVIYFSVEMPVREVLQRDASIATGIAYSKIRNRDLSVPEWEALVLWWSARHEDGYDSYLNYLKHRSFDKFHTEVSRKPLVPDHLDIIYDPNLTLGRMNAEVDKRLIRGEEIGLVVADYVQVIKRVASNNNSINHIDWQEQINVSRGLKNIAETRKIPVYSPYQIDLTGEARFSKGILDSCDAAFTLKAFKKDNPCIEFTTTKMRGADDTEVFTSVMNWSSLKLGPESTEAPFVEDKKTSFKPKNSTDITQKTSGVYDA
jgi:replicative DNA helicase